MLSTKRTLPKGLAIASQSAEFWRRLAPELTISDAQPADQILNNKEQSDSSKIRLLSDGFLHLKQPGLNAPFDNIAKAMDRIVTAGLPAAFIGVYDEVWSMVAELNSVLDGLLDGGAGMVPNFWATHSKANVGLSAQRKRPGNGVFPDGTAKSLTLWLPMTSATPDNGCIYIVPAGQDRNYGKPKSARADASLPGIRALPAAAGDVLIWTGETYHWQARPDRHNQDGHLLNLTWEFQSRKADPLEGFLIDSYPYVPFEARLGLLARQMPRHRADLSSSPVWRAVQQTLSNRFPLMAH